MSKGKTGFFVPTPQPKKSTKEPIKDDKAVPTGEEKGVDIDKLPGLHGDGKGFV